MTIAGIPGVGPPAVPAGVTGRVFTGEQRAAIAARSGSQLLSANAGSGKTAVMVERFVEAVLIDGVAVNEILALTFTEKAAGELRERLRARLLELGEGERAREADAAWVGTIHGFCARVLRAEPLAAGLDPRFTVLDEATAGRIAAQAWATALEGWAAAHGEAALALAGAYGVGLEPLVSEAHAALRSAGQTVPRLPQAAPEPRRPDCGELARARTPALEALSGARAGARMNRAREVLAACEPLLRGWGPQHPVPTPAALEAARLAGGSGLLAGEECGAYRDAFERYAQACADHHARPALALLDDLLGRFDAAYAGGKRERGSLDFADLELFTRDLFAAAPARRQRWSERFSLLMVDEFQDTNRVQLDILEALENDNLFAVGDELQSIYGFRHADVTIFRERRAALPDERIRRLTANFRSREPVLDVLNGVFAPVFGERFTPLRAGRRDGSPPDRPPVELLLTDARGWEPREAELGLSEVADQPWRRAEARRLAERIARELEAGRRPGEVVVLVRSTASLRLFEQALEERGVPTYVLGGRGYWSHEQVRDGLAYLSVLANPLDELALLGALSSPFCGAGSDALITLAEAGRRSGAGLWSALQSARGGEGLEHLDAVEATRLGAFAELLEHERERAERDSPEVLLERAVLATGYDLAILARAGGDRRMANLRKLMRLAREYDAAEGRDLRGFIAYAVGQDLGEAREGEAPLEAEDLDAVRLMTIHRAKGLEFPVVAVADLGRQGGSGRSPLLVSRDGRVGLRLATLGAGGRVDALDYRALADKQAAAEDEEERRLLYVAMTRAEELLIVSGGVDPERMPAPRPGGAPIAWVLPALLDRPADVIADPRTREAGGLCVERTWEGRPAPTRVFVHAAGDAVLGLDASVSGQGRAASDAPFHGEGRVGSDAPVPGEGPAASDAPLRGEGRVGSGALNPAAGSPVTVLAVQRRATMPVRLSYTSLQDYGRCPYRFYLQRRLRLPSEAMTGGVAGEQLQLAPVPAPALSPRLRGVVAHRLLEELDFAAPSAPDEECVSRLLREEGAEASTARDVDDLIAMVEAFGASALCARLARAVSVRREAPFAFAPRTGAEPLLNGALDVHATERDGRVLVVDYKTDRLDERFPAQVVESEYAIQRAVYALAVLASGADAVEVAYCFLERPEEVVMSTFTGADAAALADLVLASAAGVLESRWPVAGSPHRGLCGDCPGRRTLCSHPERLTLREPPPADQAPWAAQALGATAGAVASVSTSSSSSSVWSSGADADTEF